MYGGQMKKICIFVFFMLIVVLGADDCATMRNVPSGVQTLQDVINLGLCRNPQTAAAYASLRSSHFNKNAGYANYLPSVSAGVSAGKNYANQEWQDWNYGASISASYLIFDFGKRTADMNQMIATYRAAGFDYDDNIQNFVYGLIGSYYDLLNADADVKSAQMLRDVAKTARDTAQKKFNAGAVAKADVLKADTTLASRDLDLERAKNNREIAKGTLLSKLSFPADQDIKIADLSGDIGSDDDAKSLDELFEQAKKTRPDLLRATANKDAAWHRRNSVFLSNLPTISASGSVAWNDTPSETYGAGNDKISGSIGVRASMPLFAGFANLYNARAAQVNYDRAIEQEKYTQDNASLDIFSAYNNYKTAQTVLKQTETLLKSATESERVTAGMYKVGRATMLDWQTAQSELGAAEKQNNAAKYELFTKRAAVALAVGDIKAELELGDKE